MGCCNADLEGDVSPSKKNKNNPTPISRQKTAKTPLERIVEERKGNLN